MKRVTCKIQIGKYEFLNVNEVKVNSSYENLTDTATITIARKLEFEGKTLTGDSGIFKPGEAVKIYLGYDFENVLIFSGYLSDIKPGSPLELRCENDMYMLKKGAFTKTFVNTDLRKLLNEIAAGFPVKTVDCNIGTLRVTKATPAQVLNELNKTYALKSWFRNGTLYVGLAFWPELQQSPAPVFTFQKDIIEHDLLFQEEDSVRVKVTAVSINPDNTKTEVEVGDPEGEQRTLTYYNKSKKDLTEAATRDLERLRYTGFRGSFTSFGTPVVRHGDRVTIIDPVIADRNGTYIVKSVETTFGQGGYRQQIEIDAKA